MSLGGKLLSLLLLVCIVILCVLFAFQPDKRISTSEALNQNENFKQFSEDQQNFFGNGTDTSVVFSEV